MAFLPSFHDLRTPGNTAPFACAAYLRYICVTGGALPLDIVKAARCADLDVKRREAIARCIIFRARCC
eukprot:839651-Pyramimonas_sp.AAC.1